jgi:hypothetical protein
LTRASVMSPLLHILSMSASLVEPVHLQAMLMLKRCIEWLCRRRKAGGQNADRMDTIRSSLLGEATMTRGVAEVGFGDVGEDSLCKM